MIFVLGVLVLLALLGLLLIARTHGESKRVAYESTASSESTAMDGLVETVRQTLRNDIWGTLPMPTSGTPDWPLNSDLGATPSLTDPRENNEPYDAPGPCDRWLASTLPYYLGRVAANTTPPPATYEDDVLAWYRVSYLGADVIAGSKPFRWSVNSRTGAAGKTYSDDNLTNVNVLQTPPSGMTGNLIPGSTTNVTIAAARRWWTANDPLAATGTSRFPYFDTNRDGIIDLYDADGDGVPDSPISFAVPVKTADPNAPKELYAAIRVVDHASMLNVNVASSLLQPRGSAGQLTFNEDEADKQRRGRRMTELLLDDTVNPLDSAAGAANRTAALVDYRWNDPTPPNAMRCDQDLVRRKLVGGFLNEHYRTYGLPDEASLRHRGLLVPRDRAIATLAGAIDSMLPDSLLWSRPWSGAAYTGAPRWTRLNANYGSADYEGYDNAAGKGWRCLFRDDDPCTIRRPLFTTVSHEVVPPPAGVSLAYDTTAGEYFVSGLSTNPVRIVSGTNPTQLRYMDWPILSKAAFPNIPAHLRLLPIDLNMSDPTDATGEATKAKFIQYMAAAMYLALDPTVGNYQSFTLRDVDNPAAPTVDESQNREYLAWQFAANAADYRDSDGEHTVLAWNYDQADPSKVAYIYGVEKQPFLTEVYVRLVAGSAGGGPVGGSGSSADKWFTAVELYVPPLWQIPVTNLYLRLPAANRWIPLGDFRLVSAPTTPLVLLDGGPSTGTGRYYVLCGGSIADAGVNTTTFYRDSRLDVHKDHSPGSRIELVYSPSGAWDDPQHLTHVIDVIDPSNSGGNLTNNGPSGGTEFASRDALEPPTLQAGDAHTWSLWRSTKAWRFTTGWQAYRKDGCGPVGGGGQTSCCQSLGNPNNQSCVKDGLDKNVPESIWPTMVSTATADGEPKFPKPDGVGGVTLVPGFTSGQPFEAFDSVAEISRLLMVGPIRLTTGNQWGPPAWNLQKMPDGIHYWPLLQDVPVTVLLAQSLNPDTGGVGTTGDMPNPMDAQQPRTMAGRIDFIYAKAVNGTPWSHRLLGHFTTESPIYDGVDNDGNGLADLADPGEGVKVLNRVAGRININTAPPAVLRSIPFMSLLPTSAEYTQHVGGPVANPANVFTSNPGAFWDLASAIVAHRENRQVPLRLSDNTGAMHTVAIAEVQTGTGAGGPTGGSGSQPKKVVGPFVSIAELSRLNDLKAKSTAMDVSAGARHDVFAIDRFFSTRPNSLPALPIIPLYPHDIAGTRGYWSSPDFRYRADADGNALIDYRSLGDPATGTSDDNGGLRSRDIFFTRLANMVTTRSDVFTAYIALLDENGDYVARCQVTLDRSVCFEEDPESTLRRPILPSILFRQDGSYVDDTK